MADKGQSFIKETITGRELTRQRAFKYLALSVICGIVFGLTAVGVVLLAKRAGLFRPEVPASETEHTLAGTQEKGATGDRVKDETVKGGTAPGRAEDSSSASDSETAAEPGKDGEKPEGTSEDGENAAGLKDGSPDSKGKAAGRETADGDGDTGLNKDASRENKTGKDSGGKNEEEASEQKKKSIKDAAENGGGMDKDGKEQTPGEEEGTVPEEERPERLGGRLPVDTGKSVVTVETVSTDDTWFGMPIESASEHAGIILAAGESEILILTVTGAVSDNSTYRVVFHDGTRQSAVLKSKSEQDRICLLAVPVEGLGSDFMDALEVIEADREKLPRCGDLIYGVGAPLGKTHSRTVGVVGYSCRGEQIYDGEEQVFYADILSDADAGTFILDADGKLTGLCTANEGGELAGTRVVAAGNVLNVTDAMMEGQILPYTGVKGVGVNFDMLYSGVPAGVYVTDLDVEGPAYACGVKRGDIITRVGENAVAGMKDFYTAVNGTGIGQDVTFVLKRASLEGEYKELEVAVKAAGRWENVVYTAEPDKAEKAEKVDRPEKVDKSDKAD